MAITIELAPEQEVQLIAQANSQGLTPANYLKSLAGLNPISSDITAWEEMIDSFDAGEEADHRETLDLLKKTIDADRPGQRSIFGQGVNPPVGYVDL